MGRRRKSKKRPTKKQESDPDDIDTNRWKAPLIGKQRTLKEYLDTKALTLPLSGGDFDKYDLSSEDVRFINDYYFTVRNIDYITETKAFFERYLNK